jgi:transposase
MIGLLSLQALDSSQRVRIWLASEATDMRCGFDRLAERVRAVIGKDLLSGHWFVFRSRHGERLKILTWDRDGYTLWYKRLEKGAFSCHVWRRERVRWSYARASWRWCWMGSMYRS